MNILKTLTIKKLKLNKKRSIMTIIGITLSVAMLAAVSSMFFSCKKSLITYQIIREGDFHYIFNDVEKEDINTISFNKNVDSIYLTTDLGYAVLPGIKNEDKPYVHLLAFNEDAIHSTGLNLIEGRMPKNSKEVVIPSHLQTNGKVKLNVGDEITLDIGYRLVDGSEVNQDFMYTPGKEEITNQTKYTFKIVGIIERPSKIIESYSSPGYTFITLLDQNINYSKVDVYTKYNKKGIKNHLETTANILEIDPTIYKIFYTKMNTLTNEEFTEYKNIIAKAKYNLISNDYLLLLETSPVGDNALTALFTTAVIVCIIIIFTSTFCIKNSFDISVSEGVREYGMLSSIGATKKQIKKSVYFEAFILGLCGIPLGILGGLFASFILITISNYLLSQSFAIGLQLKFSFSLLAIILAILLGIITIFLSARKSAKVASKITPIEAIRNNSEIKIKSNKIKSPKIINKLFGIGGEISYKNLKRSKRKYRTTVVSIVICVAIFIALSTFTSYSFNLLKLDFSNYNYDLSVSKVGDSKDELNEIRDLNEITEMAVTTNYSLEVSDPNKYVTKEYLNYTKENSVSNNYISFILLDDDYYREYLKKLNLNYEEMYAKLIYIDKYFEVNDNKKIEMTKFKFKENSLVTFATDNNKYDFVIGYNTNEKPFFVYNVNSNHLLIGDALYFKDNFKEYNPINNYVYIKSNDATKTEENIENIYKDYDISIDNISKNTKQMEYFFILIAIFLYGFITVIALIGITNIFNTITTNMNLRRKEFAVLRSIGMSNKEFKRMIRLESLFYGVKSLLIGIPLGLILSYIIYHYISDGDIILAYSIPIGPIIITCLVVFILIFTIMKYSLKKINAQNMLETIRNENI